VPEGHVAHRNARRLGAALAGAPLERVVVAEPRLAPQRIDRRLAGDRVDAVEAIGKHMVVRFASGRALHSHLGMVGSWRILDAAPAPPARGLWLALVTADHVAAQYRGPRLRLHEPGEPIVALAAVGPDLLGADVDPADATAAALARADPAMSVAEALLDQRLVAGVGNVYRSEALFLCGVAPGRPVGTLPPARARELGRVAAELLAQGALRSGPIATRRPRDPRSRERTWVYGRAGRPCRRCGATVRADRLGAQHRTVFWCPVCQPSADGG
jgi:endonuclease-8